MKRAVAILMTLLIMAASSGETLLFVAETIEDATEQSLVASDEERAESSRVGEEDDVPIYAAQVRNGDYEIEVESSSSMFRIVACTLHVSEEEMTADMTLSGTGYLRLFMGTGKEAVAAGKEGDQVYSEFTEDAEGKYVYTVPVEALNQTLECTGFSKRKEKWYDHQISFRAESLPEGVVDVSAAEAAALSAEETAGESMEPQQEESTEEAEPLLIVQQTVAVPDGTYQTAVTMSGGSGKASIDSPATITVNAGLATARIVWSSPHYDYMIVNGEKYLPVQTGSEASLGDSGSVFEIPVLLFDEPFPVIADTTAMSQPHEITYELTFDLAGMKEMAPRNDAHLATEVMLVIFVLLGVFLAVVIVLLIRQRRDEGRE